MENKKIKFGFSFSSIKNSFNFSDSKYGISKQMIDYLGMRQVKNDDLCTSSCYQNTKNHVLSQHQLLLNSVYCRQPLIEILKLLNNEYNTILNQIHSFGNSEDIPDLNSYFAQHYPKKNYMFNFLQQTCRFGCDYGSDNQVSSGNQENIFQNVLNGKNSANVVDVNKCSIQITSDKLLTTQVKHCKNHNDPETCTINVLMFSEWLRVNSQKTSIKFISKFVEQKYNSVDTLFKKILQNNKKGYQAVINHFKTTFHKDYAIRYFDTESLNKFISQIESNPQGFYYKYVSALKSLSTILNYLNKLSIKIIDCKVLIDTKKQTFNFTLFESLDNNVIVVKTNLGSIKLLYNKGLNQDFSQTYGSNHNLQNLFKFKFLRRFTDYLFHFAFLEGQLKLADANLFVNKTDQDYFQRCNHCIENKNLNELNIPHELAAPLLGIYTLPDGYNQEANRAFSIFLAILILKCFDSEHFPLTQQLTFKIMMLHKRYFLKYLSK